MSARTCENQPLTVHCEEGDVIHVINAHYGRLEEDPCPGSYGTPNTQCLSTGARDLVYDRSGWSNRNLRL